MVSNLKAVIFICNRVSFISVAALVSVGYSYFFHSGFDVLQYT